MRPRKEEAGTDLGQDERQDTTRLRTRGPGCGTKGRNRPRTKLRTEEKSWEAGTGPGQGLRDRIRAWDVFWDTGTGQEAGISPRMRFRALEEGPG